MTDLLGTLEYLKRMAASNEPRITVPTDDIRHLIAELEGSVAEAAALREALAPFARYAEQWGRQPLRGLGDVIHAIHTNTEYEAEIRLSDCELARTALTANAGRALVSRRAEAAAMRAVLKRLLACDLTSAPQENWKNDVINKVLNDYPEEKKP